MTTKTRTAATRARKRVKSSEKQPTRQRKVICMKDGYNMRITDKWLNEAVPKCPMCGKTMTVEMPDE